ncbi:MAG: hypothetical protein ABI534_01725 [Chloroflexota bacterium]
MNGFFGSDLAGTVGTWTAAVATLVVWGHLAGERRLFTWAQYLLAGLLSGYLAVLAVREVLMPRLVEPLVAAPAERLELWPAAMLVIALIVARHLPRTASIVPISILVGGIAAFALSGAVVGTILPQLAAGVTISGGDPITLGAGIAGAAVSALVLVAFVHGMASGPILGAASSGGRWLIVAGMGAWLGLLLLTSLVLLVDRIAFLLRDWLGLLP